LLPFSGLVGKPSKLPAEAQLAPAFFVGLLFDSENGDMLFFNIGLS
jgi:hypothetical protein